MIIYFFKVFAASSSFSIICKTGCTKKTTFKVDPYPLWFQEFLSPLLFKYHYPSKFQLPLSVKVKEHMMYTNHLYTFLYFSLSDNTICLQQQKITLLSAESVTYNSSSNVILILLRTHTK